MSRNFKTLQTGIAVKLAHQACSVRQSTSSIKFPEAEEIVRWGDGVGTQAQENQPVAGPLTHRLCQGGSTCGDTVPPSLIPAQHLCPQRAWHISLRGLMCKCALVEQAELEQLAMERSFQLRKPPSETQMALTVFLFSSAPWHRQEEKVRGHEIWKFTLSTLPS